MDCQELIIEWKNRNKNNSLIRNSCSGQNNGTMKISVKGDVKNAAYHNHSQGCQSRLCTELVTCKNSSHFSSLNLFRNDLSVAKSFEIGEDGLISVRMTDQKNERTIFMLHVVGQT